MSFFAKLFLLIIFLSGCATLPENSHSLQRSVEKKPAGKRGTYHKVKKGETLWRISKMYDVDLEKIVRLNRLSDATKISQGQLIFVPAKKAAKAIHNTKTKDIDSGYFIWPLKGKVVSFFGLRNSDNTINKGINILAKRGTDVLAAKAGRVIFCSDKVKGFGKTIIVEHRDNFSSVYANNQVILVGVGQDVRQGEPIAKVGKTQRTKDYILHFEIRRGHIPQNPFYFLP